MGAAIVQVCVDPRLNHELIRIQIKQRLQRSGISANRIFVLNEIGGNPGPNLRHTLDLLSHEGEPVVFGAVLHHDDCAAARHGLRIELDVAAHQVAVELQRVGASIPVATGNIRTENNHVLWSDDTQPGYQPFTFGPGRL